MSLFYQAVSREPGQDFLDDVGRIIDPVRYRIKI